VGIDLGTTISLLASAQDDDRVATVNTRDGGPRLRSIVHVAADASTIVGEAAARMASLEPDAVFAFFKRSMGAAWSVSAGGREWAPQDLSALVLDALLEDATAQLGARPTSAVVTIPAYFGDDARRATLQAGEQANLDVLALLHEPTAACIASRRLIGDTGTALVYDLGGGTFDVSVVRFRGPDAEVLATAGDHRLGGKDWDDLIVDLVAERLQDELGSDPRDDPSLLGELQERAREAKHALSRLDETAVTLQVAGRVHRVELDRVTFWRRGQALFDRTAELIARVVDDVGGRAQIDHVLLAGGSTRMPPCADVVLAQTGLTPIAGVNADEAVVTGAALFARGAAGAHAGAANAVTRRDRVRDVTAHALGFVVVSADGTRYVNQVMIARNAALPARVTKRQHLELPGAGESAVLSVYMLQGEAERPLDTEPLGRWTFTGIRAKRRSSVEVDVSYSYNEDGVVEVSAAIAGELLGAPEIDRDDRNLSWTDGDPREQPSIDLAVALAIDVSSSMDASKLREAKEACIGFIDELEEAGLGERVAVVSFASNAMTVVRIGEQPARARRAVEGLSSGGSTDMAAGLRTAGDRLSDGGRRVIVLLTDGEPNDRKETLAVRGRLVSGDVELITRGVSGADAAFLAELSTGDGELVGAGQLGGSFRGIARQLARSAAIRRA
jgi:molecular chaperone DnaK (HSP70)